MRSIPRATVLAAWLLASAGAHALPGDSIQPFIAYGITADDNVFRQDLNPSSDIIHQLDAGLNIDWKPGRQQILGRIAASQAQFIDNDIKVDGQDLLGRWNWQLGNLWSGHIEASHNKRLNSFDSVNASVADNTVTERKRSADVRYRLHPRWQVRAGLSRNSLRYSNVTQNDRDRDIDRATAGIDYFTPKGSRFGAEYIRSEGKFPNRQVVGLTAVDNSYDQDAYNLRMDWNVTGKARVLARLGWVSRTHGQISARDYEGLAGRVEGQWQATGKVRLIGALYREIEGVSEQTASYSLDDGVEFGPDWQISPKLALQTRLTYETRAFEGDPTLGTGGTIRSDEVAFFSLNLIYQPFLSTNVTLTYQNGKRASNLVQDYDFQSLGARVQVTF